MPLAVTVQIRTPLPVSISELPALEVLAHKAIRAHGVDPATVTMRQDEADLVLSYELTAS